MQLATSTLRVASQRIYHGKNDSFPDGYRETILKILQTTSCPSFNEQYKLYEQEILRANALAIVGRLNNAAAPAVPGAAAAGGAPARNDLQIVEDYLDLALALYQGHIQNQTWPASSSSSEGSNKQAALNNQSGVTITITNPCFNCGKPGCTPGTCALPLDQQRIEKNKEAHKEKKKKERAAKKAAAKSDKEKSESDKDKEKKEKEKKKKRNTSKKNPWKWLPPREGESNRRKIAPKDTDVAVWHEYDAEGKFWRICDQNEGSGASAALNTATSPTSSSSTDAAVAAALARLTQEVANIITVGASSH